MKLVSTALKNERGKYIFNEQVKLQEAKNRPAEENEDNDVGFDGPDRAQTVPDMRASFRNTRKASMKFSLEDFAATRAATAVPIHEGGSENSSLARNHLTFDTSLKNTLASDDFNEELMQQVERQSQDSRRIFDSLLVRYKGGVPCQFRPNRDFEVVDVNALVQAAQPVRTGTVKLEDFSNMKKKDGIALFFDPTINTEGIAITMRIYFQKQIDLVTEESCHKDFVFRSNGNYYGLHLVEESPDGGGAGGMSVRSGISAETGSNFGGGGGGGGGSAYSTPSPSKKTANRPDGGGAIPERWLPGWQNRAPIFIPSTRCSIEILATTSASQASAANVSEHNNGEGGEDDEEGDSARQNAAVGGGGGGGGGDVRVGSSQRSAGTTASNRTHKSNHTKNKHKNNNNKKEVAAHTAQVPASVAYNLSHLRLFAVPAPSARAAVRKLHEFCDNFFLAHTSNLQVDGRISALNLAALHGNLQAVILLVSNGADVNARHRESKSHTALHEAVIGGHKDVAAYLLANGANQLLRDDIGYGPMHHACKLENIALARILINDSLGKRALLMADNNDQKPIELCTSPFMKLRIEGAMRKMKIFVKPRVSILDR
eukprot:CAMPEP_0174979158 /NCGR_PEP_ID=MMETSP0004_2-20121128/14617_1 /TAXON_ID=420556 /ORGANISM="Ochromonas sp., Strain CCMP1393" /LENGTH=600 /DNA_ID=CAMNT_0016230637 /DNA_START=202 /DNA_END=2004 /DNA_ORIENTATION=-